MANLDQLTEQILADARGKAAEILSEAQAQADRRTEDARKNAMTRKETMIHRARTDAELLSERIVSGTNLEIRDEKLSAKGRVIDRVMERVLEKLSLLSKEDILNYIAENLKGRSFSPKETVYVREDVVGDVKKLLGNVNVEGRKDLTGFIIDKDGVLENQTFETRLDFMQEELEAEAAQILFSN